MQRNMVAKIIFLLSAAACGAGEGTHDPGGEAPAPCRACHTEAHARWVGSHHALAQRAAGSSHAVDGEPRTAQWTIGVAPLVQLVLPMERGRFQVTQQAWDTERGEWFDVFADDRQAGEWGHWTGRGMTWNTMCASCHTTHLTVGYDARTDSFDTRFDALGVTCEGCHAPHGPGERSATVECAVCHARATPLTGGYRPGDAWLDHFLPAIPDETESWYPDGQVRDELFEEIAFRSSAMHEAGVTCADCHDPHTGALREEGDALCVSCHATREGWQTHDHHPEGSVACVDCHMPATTYMQRHRRRDHGLRIPDPALSRELGTPLACDACHDAVRVPEGWWPGLVTRPHRAVARALAASRRGEGPEAQLAARTEAGSFDRIVLIGVLGPWVGDARVRDALGLAAGDPDPWTRWSAARALGVAPTVESEGVLFRLIDDPVRAVRVQALLGLRHRLAPRDPRARDLLGWLERDLHQPASRVLLGTWLADHGALSEAEGLLRTAVAWDPTGVGARVALAVTLARQHRTVEARQLLEEGLIRAPDNAELRFRLALARLGERDLEAAESDLRATLALHPTHARAWYNLGLLLDGRGDRAGAIEALREADRAAPRPPDALWALATVLARSGDREASRTLAAEVLVRDPDHAEARAWLARLEER